MYHSIDDTGPASLTPYRVSPANFAAQMCYLRDNGFHSITLDELVTSMTQRRKLSGKPVIITFDDGYRNFLTHAWPAIEAAGFTAVMFVVSEKVGTAADWDQTGEDPIALMNWDELRGLHARGLCIGSHTATHPDLLTLSHDQIVEQGRTARSTLFRELGHEVTSIAFPYGRENEAVRRSLTAAGYRIAVGTWGGICDFICDPMNLPRIEIFNDDDIPSFAAKLSVPHVSVEAADNKVGSAGEKAVPPSDAHSTKHGVGRRLAEPNGVQRSQGALIHPEYASRLASRLDRLVRDFVVLHSDLLNASNPEDALSARIAKLFRLPVIGVVERVISPYHELSAGVWVGFVKGAHVELTIDSKTDELISPNECSNGIVLQFSGQSSFLTIEAACGWTDIGSAEHFQIGFYAEVSRAVACRVILRMSLKSGKSVDHPLAALELRPGVRQANRAVDLTLPDFVEIDLDIRPRLMIFLDSKSDLAIRIDYMTMYFD